ncbi:TetR/AcrR family transcriptional regulator [Novacetimonas pomaceti]|nr:TetR/AcrR family transcriptional regulator [Novacetimonas pomaceti]MBV1834776.1 TetR/AcrR family transcriptional regulator [Novacetimonas pomaceti]
MARAYHKGNVAEDLRLTTLRILQTERLEDLSVRRLTREVRVAPANFYNHYDSLNTLLLEIAADCLEDFATTIGHIARRSPSRHDALKRTVTHYVEFACRHTQLYRVTFGYLADSAQHLRYDAAMRRTFERLRALVAGDEFPHVESDEPELPARDTAHIGHCIFAMAHGLAGMIAHGHVDVPHETDTKIQDFVERIIDLFTHAPLGRHQATACAFGH